MHRMNCVLMSVLLMIADGLFVKGPSGPLVAPLGSSVVLPCYGNRHSRTEGLEVEWKRTDSETLVHLYQDGESQAEAQHTDYQDRAHFFTEEIQHGNFSLRLDKLRAEDDGQYKCTVFSQQESGETVVQIKVYNVEHLLVSGSSRSISASVGEDITLNCSVDSHIPPEGIDVSWKKTDEDGDILVLLYQDNEAFPDLSDERYRDRVEFFSDEILKLNFSLRLKSVRIEDKGVYMCEVFAGGLSANTTVELEQLGGKTTSEDSDSEKDDIKMDNATLSMFDNKLASEIMSAIYVIVILANLSGNGISLFLLLMRTFPKTPSIIFMINLTITDLIVGIMLPFQITYQMQGYNWTLGAGMCNVLTVVFFVNMYCSILFMTFISADRYLGIVKPMRYREMRKRKTFAIIACIFIWLLVLVILIPLESTNLTFEVKERNITTCFDVLRKDMLPSTAHWAGFLFIILFLCPFIITVYCYIIIIYVLVRKTNSKQKGHTVRLACIVLSVYIFCFAPNNILLLAHSIARLFYDKSLYIYYKLTLSLSCVNSCIDPFIYYFASKEFRRKLRQMLRSYTLSTRETQMIEETQSTQIDRETFSLDVQCKLRL